MPIQVRLFASLRERAGWSERMVTPEGPSATPLSLWQQLQLPDGGGCPASGRQGNTAPLGAAASAAGGERTLPDGVRVAINQAFAAADTPLADGDELAFLPPISGG